MEKVHLTRTVWYPCWFFVLFEYLLHPQSKVPRDDLGILFMNFVAIYGECTMRSSISEECCWEYTFLSTSGPPKTGQARLAHPWLAQARGPSLSCQKAGRWAGLLVLKKKKKKKTLLGDATRRDEEDRPSELKPLRVRASA